MHRINLHSLVTSATNFKVLISNLKVSRANGDNFALHNRPFYQSSGEIIAEIGDAIDMPVTAAAARKFLNLMAALPKKPLDASDYRGRALEDVVQDLLTSFSQEAMSRIAVVIAPTKAALFSDVQPLFGEAVSLKFAKASADISEAGKCLALQRPTACVFHLMRAVEYAVQRLGKKLHVQIDVEKETWYQITLHINKAVDALPNQTTAQRQIKQKYAATSAHLNSVRIATRNDVMHPKATYTDEEAQTLFDATKALMQQLAKIV